MKGKAAIKRVSTTILVFIAILLPHLRISAQDVSRLIAEVSLANDSVKYSWFDSTTYTYSGTRTSNWKTGQHLYDTAIYLVASSSLPTARYMRTYDTANRIVGNTMQEYKSGGWRNKQQFIYKYLSGKLYDTVWSNTWDTTNLKWETKRIYIYKYTTSLRQDSIYWLKPGGTGFVVEAIDEYLYTDSLLTVHILDVWNDTLARWDRWQQETYHYDAIGKVDTYWNYAIDMATLTTQPERKEVYVYDVNKRIAGLWKYYWFVTSQSWQGLNEHYYTYNTHGDVIQEVVNYWDLFVQMWGPQSKIYYYYDFAYNPTDIIEKRFDNPVYKDYSWVKWLYNSSGLPTEKANYTWNDVLGVWLPEKSNASKKRYYYETNSGIASKNKTDDWLIVYPNPASAVITIKSDRKVSASCYISLSDMQGRLVRQWYEVLGSGASAVLHVNGVSSGNYLLKVNDGNTEMTKLLIVANQ